MPPTHRYQTRDQRFTVLVMNFLAALVLLIAVAAVSATVSAASAAANSEMGPSVRPGDMGAGSLLLRGVGEEAYRAALVQKTEAEIEVSGLITRAVVRQTFENHSTIHMEGIYVFPLPNGAAVDGLRLVVGERVIEGRIEERKKAQAQFAQAKRQGKRAAMVEAERPNIFTTSVANIAPGETVRVEIRYQQTLTYKNDELRLRFPMVVGPRFIPGPGRIAHFGQDGWAANPVLVGSAKVPPKTDGERIAQPVERPGPNGERTLNPVSLTIRLNAGFPLMEIKSHHHKVTLDTIGEGRRVITLDPGTVPADRDFELTWRPLQGASPQAGLFVETDAPVRTGPHTRHALLMLLPPHAGAVDKARPPRELLFILDTSGSMGGASIRQAKAALDRALDSLGGGDHFNIVEFNSLHSVLFPASMPADAVHLTHARAWISGLAADGGTNMAPALAAALGQPVRAGLLRQVVFLTDGAVGDEARLFALIGKELGAARLFTVGIGSAPNSHFMAGAARAGRGSYLHIGSTAQVGARMDELIAKLSLPALTDIQVRFEGGGATELARDPVPDLYAGEPLMVAVKLTGRVETMTVTGRRGGEVWSQAMDLQGGQMGAGIAKLWAQRRIAALEEDPDRNEDRSGTEAKVLALALDYGLVSRLTALIAIDNVITRGDEDPLLSQAMAANLPADWQYDKVFGKPSPLRMRRASMHLQPTPHASAYSGAYTGGGAVGLPATATPSSMLMAGGLILLLLSLALFGWRRVGLRP